MNLAASTRRLDSVIDQAIAEKHIVGTVVMLSQDGELIYQRAAGFADREASVDMREDTIFRLSSLTKPIVTAVAMQLVEEGRLELDAPVSRYLPLFRPRLADGVEPVISLRQLLTHTSGLGYRFLMPPESVYHTLNISDGLDQPGLSLDENLHRLASAPLNFMPGERWDYSLGIDVIGAVIESVLDRSLADVVRERITEPIGMADTAFHITDLSRLAKPYVDGKPEAPVVMTDGMAVHLNLPLFEGWVRFDPSRVFHPSSYPSGGAGMAGTAGDMLCFLETIRTGGAPILKTETVAEMLRDQVGTAAQTQGEGWGFGYGWAVLADGQQSDTPQAQGTIQWGGVYGHYWFVDPVRKLTLVSLTNTTFEGMSGVFPFAVRDAVYG